MSRIQEALSRAMPRIANRLRNELVLAAPVDNGLLRNSIQAEAFNDKVVITMDLSGLFAEYGTRPHIIKPKTKEALKFEVGRKARLAKKSSTKNIVFAKSVKHPGTRPNPFIRNTMYFKLPNIVKEELQREIR